MKKNVSLICMFVFFTIGAYSQNVGINSSGATPNASALLDVDASPSNDKGILIPRISLTQTTSNAPVGAGVATSLMVYNTATVNDVTPGYYYWDGAKWVRLLGSNNAWLLLGNAGTTAGTNFIGTTDAVDWVVKTNNTERMRVLSGGNVGIGTAAPAYPLHVYGSSNSGLYQVNENANAGASTIAAVVAKSNAGLAGFQITSTAGGSWAEFGTSGNGGFLYSIWNNTGDHCWRTTALSTERMRLTSAGFLGVGTTTPSAKVDIAFSTTTGGLSVTGPATNVTNGMLVVKDNDNGAAAAWPGGGHIVIWPSSTGLGIMRFQKSGISNWSFIDRSTVNTNAGRIFTLHDDNGGGDVITALGSGNVGIGQTTPAFKLDVTGNGRYTSDLWANTKIVFNQDATNYWIGQGIGNGYIVQTWDEVRYQFNGGGSSISMKNGAIGIGITAPTAALHVVGNICYTGGIGACSDARYKKDLTPLNNALANVLKINGLNYYWKTEEFPDNKFTTDKQIGFIAQDLEKIYPEVVITDKNGYKSVDYAKLTPILVEAIKDQQKIIDSQQSSIQDLKASVKDVQTENKNLKMQYENRLQALEVLLNARAQK